MSNVLYEESLECSQVLRKLVAITPRDIGSILLHASRRDVVNAFARGWVNKVKSTSSPQSSLRVPNSTNFDVSVCPDHMECDLDKASVGDIKLCMDWLCQVTKSRHLLNGKHCVVLYSADRIDVGHLKSLLRSPFCVVVATTSRPSLSSIRQLSSLVHVRVPHSRKRCAVPSAAATQLEVAREIDTPSRFVKAVHALRCTGFTPNEIARFAYQQYSPNVAPDMIVSILGSISSVASSDDRALDALVMYLRKSSKLGQLRHQRCKHGDGRH